jgi:hypothetical protein
VVIVQPPGRWWCDSEEGLEREAVEVEGNTKFLLKDGLPGWADDEVNFTVGLKEHLKEPPGIDCPGCASDADNQREGR